MVLPRRTPKQRKQQHPVPCAVTFLIKLITSLFSAVLGLRCSAGFSLVAASGGCSRAVGCGSLIAAASLGAEPKLWSTWFPEAVAPGRSGAQASQLWLSGLDSPWHMGSSWTRDHTLVSCVGRQVLYH